MSGEETAGAFLSREELDALLASATEGALREEQAGRGSRPYLGQGCERARPGRLAPLLRALDAFGDAQGRLLSTLYQVGIEFAPLAWEELTPRELRASLLETDRVALLALEPGGQRAYLVLGRALLFGWMSLAFGARSPSGPGAVPARGFTRVEERFLRRAASELTAQLEKAWRPRHELAARCVGLEEPERLLEDDQGPLLAASFDVKGMGELCRLRVLLPPAAFADPKPAGAAARVARGVPAETLLDTSLRVRVEAGSAELSLAAIARIQPGDVLALERSDPHGLLVLLEDNPRFRAEPGEVDGRLAVRITGRV